MNTSTTMNRKSTMSFMRYVKLSPGAKHLKSIIYGLTIFAALTFALLAAVSDVIRVHLDISVFLVWAFMLLGFIVVIMGFGAALYVGYKDACLQKMETFAEAVKRGENPSIPVFPTFGHIPENDSLSIGCGKQKRHNRRRDLIGGFRSVIPHIVISRIHTTNPRQACAPEPLRPYCQSHTERMILKPVLS